MEYKLETINPNKLIALKENPRKHPEQLIDKIEKSMSKFGFVAPIIALKGSNEIIAGHGRHKTATKMKMKKVILKIKGFNSYITCSGIACCTVG